MNIILALVAACVTCPNGHLMNAVLKTGWQNTRTGVGRGAWLGRCECGKWWLTGMWRGHPASPGYSFPDEVNR